MNNALLNGYLRDIEKAYRNGNATEHTYRSNLKDLCESLFPGIAATNEPKRIKCGAPDFIITNKQTRSEEHTSELQSRQYLVCRLLLEKKKRQSEWRFRS